MRIRLVWWAAGLAVMAGLVYLMATADTGPADPIDVGAPQSHATVVFNSAVIVFREGLEAILIFAAVTASLLGANRGRRKPLAAGAGVAFVALGFTSVYREGFEVVLFLQSLQLQTGTATVLQGVAIGLAGTAAVGMLTFWLHHRLPYRRMLVLTGMLLAVVLVVMTGGTASTFQDLGWLPSTPLPFTMPGWLGAWFEIYGTYETIACQLAAAILVVGSYVVAEHLKVRRPARAGTVPARRPDAPPASAA